MTAGDWHRPLTVPKTGAPVVRFVFEQCNKQQISLAELARRSGVHRETIVTWKRRGNPNYANIEAVLNTLGYTLAIRRRK